jgi:tRNA(fMet)-specific endonuclease VapC
MILLDTDTLTLYLAGHEGVRRRVEQAEDDLAITIITRIEILQGRFAFLLKAKDGAQLLQAAQRLAQSETDLAALEVVPIDAAAGAVFDSLSANKKLKKIGRPDLLIASIALAHRATLVTRNLRHFREVPQLKVEDWAD